MLLSLCSASRAGHASLPALTCGGIRPLPAPGLIRTSAEALSWCPPFLPAAGQRWPSRARSAAGAPLPTASAPRAARARRRRTRSPPVSGSEPARALARIAAGLLCVCAAAGPLPSSTVLPVSPPCRDSQLHRHLLLPDLHDPNRRVCCGGGGGALRAQEPRRRHRRDDHQRWAVTRARHTNPTPTCGAM